MLVAELQELEEVKTLVNRGQQLGVLTFGDVATAVAEVDLDESDVEDLYGHIEKQGIELVEDALLHRLQEGQLLMVGAPGGVIDFGIDVRLWVGEALSDAALTAKNPQVEEVLRRDPRVADVTVRITRTIGADASRWSLRIAIRALTVNGETINRIVGVSQVSVEFLAEGR